MSIFSNSNVSLCVTTICAVANVSDCFSVLGYCILIVILLDGSRSTYIEQVHSRELE